MHVPPLFLSLQSRNTLHTDQVALAKTIQQEHKTNNSLMDRFLRTLNVSIAK